MSNLTKCSVCGWEWDGNAQCDHKYGFISDEELYNNISVDYDTPPINPLNQIDQIDQIDQIYKMWDITKKMWEQELYLLFSLTKIKQNNIPIIDNYMTLFSIRSTEIQETLKSWIFHYGNENYLMSEFNEMRSKIEYYLDKSTNFF